MSPREKKRKRKKEGAEKTRVLELWDYMAGIQKP
jgi:hypothetical protein